MSIVRWWHEVVLRHHVTRRVSNSLRGPGYMCSCGKVFEP